MVEMESTSVAAAAYGRHVPFLGLRAITDESTQDIDWRLDAIVDRAGRVSAPKVMAPLLRRPMLLRTVLRLRSSSRVAGSQSGRTLMALLQLPEEDLLAMVGALSPVAAVW